MNLLALQEMYPSICWILQNSNDHVKIAAFEKNVQNLYEEYSRGHFWKEEMNYATFHLLNHIWAQASYLVSQQTEMKIK
jgi:hypothetical protein